MWSRPPDTQPAPKVRPSAQLSRREIAELREKLRGDEPTPDGMAAFFGTVEPLIHFVHFSGQRFKDPSKLGRNSPNVITQRVHVLTYMLYPSELEIESLSHTTLAKHLGISKSMVMRAVKDFNVAFGIYATSQKNVSTHGEIGGESGTYVLAGIKGHQTRRRREAERQLTTQNQDNLP